MRTAIALFCAATMTALAGASEDINEIRKLVATDAGFLDALGWSIDASASRVLVGARLDSVGGVSSGAAYIFDPVTGEQLFKLRPSDAAQSDNIGISVALTETRAIVGAMFGEQGVVNSGSVYVFDLSTGEQITEITPVDAATDDRFGFDIDAEGSRVLIGAPLDDDNGADSGSAYLFNLDGNSPPIKLVADDASAGDQFGIRVALDGGFAIIGVPLDDPVSSASGSVYIFDATTGQQLQKLVPSDAQPGDQNGAQFGSSVAISGNLLAVGAPQADDEGFASGAVYVYDASTGQELHRLTASDAEAAAIFGYSVATNGQLVIAGAPGANGETGAVYVFDAQSGHELYRVAASDADPLDYFGWSVAAVSNRAYTGATRDDDMGDGAGAAYVIDITPCYADVTGDGVVNLADLNRVLLSFGLTTMGADTNFDGVVDLADLNRVLNEFGTDCP